MNNRPRSYFAVAPLILLLCALAAISVSLPSASQTLLITLNNPLSTTTSASYSNQPITSTDSTPPQLMITLSRDHQLHYKAYNDYSDLDNDGVLETTYKHSIDYYGYFDSYKCYTYVSANNRFEPSSTNTDKYCTAKWSGNFLNWASMTRMDAIRKLLYGGLRSTDTATDTVLERDLLPSDAHAFAKYYNGSDIDKLTPFTGVVTTPPSTTSATSNSINNGSKSFTITSGGLGVVSVGDQIRITAGTDETKYMMGYVTAFTATTVTVTTYANGGSGTNLTSWTLRNLTQTGISFCNLNWAGTGSGQLTQTISTATYPPLLRVALGDFELWGANERWQCNWREEQGNTGGISDTARNGNLAFLTGLNASSASPRKDTHGLGTGSAAGSSNTAQGEYIVRVKSCVAGLLGKERCKQYPTGTVTKPIGLLQIYGEDNRINFGLLTPSFDKNVSGGVVRKNTGGLSDEINTNTNGTFKTPPTTGNIIGTLNKFRIYGYRYSDGTYIGDTSTNGEDCNFQRTGIVPSGATGNQVNEGKCVSWGNPIGEAYIESLRYLAGKTPNSVFAEAANGKDTVLGLTQVSSWTDPVSSSNYCASLNVMLFNASVNSYDGDQTGGLTDLKGSPNPSTVTDTLGQAESIHNNNWFIGRSGAAQDSLCTSKSITSLGSVLGICPEAPSLNGSFQLAGAAFQAHTNKIRNDFTVNSQPAPSATDTASLKVTTYSVALATNTPRIVVKNPSNSSSVVIQPAYRLDLGTNGVGGGAIVDFRVVYQDLVNGRGKFYVSWEDSAQGGDYDQDVWGYIEYAISGNTIQITTDVVAESTNQPQGFGYIVSGTTKDGAHFHSGIEGFSFNDTTQVTVRTGGGSGTTVNGSNNIGNSGGCSSCQVDDVATTVTYTLNNNNSSNELKDPLFYAAKYGGFVDKNGDGKPDQQSEWDSKLANGQPGSDNLPDTYFFVSNPTALEASLKSALDAIIAKTASGTAAAVVSNAREGQGAVYQALYEPSRTDNNGRRVTWIGALQALFIDSFGRLREDDGDKQLEENDYTKDPVVEAFYDATDRTTKLRRYTGNPANNISTVLPLSELKTIWNARDQLLTVTSPENQRTYSTAAGTGRYIFTNIDANQNGTVDTNEIVDFLPSSFGSDKFGLLNVITQTDAENVVNYIRGQEISGLRSRAIDYNNNGTVNVARLGDIAQSTPTPVSAPAESFNLLYNDITYATFAKKYAQRRTMIYVGANDGMLHAFNGGFFDNTLKQFKTQYSSETAHPLGSEIWAYVPYNLLPHLRWLTENSYSHVYYMDGKPNVYDARVFTAEVACGTTAMPTPTATGCVHPNGWGTLLVAGMRFGGSPLTLSPPLLQAGFSGITNTGTPSTLNFRSAYVVMDITNPEQAPTVLAEITDPALDYTTASPTIAVFSQRGVTASTSTTAEKWYLIFGNGPDNASTSQTARSAGLYVYDIKNKAFATGYAPKALGSGSASSFIGDATAVDWDFNFTSDAIYFGTSSGSASSPGGHLYKINTNGNATPSSWSAPEILVDPSKPIVDAPTVTLDDIGNKWVYAGTGRFYVQGDKTSSPQQSLFGVIDSPPASAVTLPAANISYSSLLETSGATVTRNGTVSGISPSSVTNPADSSTLSLTSEKNLVLGAQITSGWKYSLTSGTSSPAERVVSNSSLFGQILFTTPFTPSATQCEGTGNSRLLTLYYKTGTPRAAVPTLGSTTNSTATTSDDPVIASVSLGSGQAAGPSLHFNKGQLISTGGGSGGGTTTELPPADCNVSALSQTSTSAITNNCAKVDNSVFSAEIDWRDSRRTR